MESLHEALAGRRFGVVLSAGYFGFFGHAGFMQALDDAGLRPAAYAGSSAGGLVAALCAGGRSPAQVCELLCAQERADFWDPSPWGALLSAARGGVGATGLLAGERFRALLERSLPAPRMEDCEHPLVLVATRVRDGEAATFERGALAPRVHATCAYPGLFRAADVDGEPHWDGGLVDKAPLLALAESEAGRSLDAFVVHYLPSQTGRPPGGPFAYAQALARGMSTLRASHFELQARLVQATGRPVFVVRSALPPLSPRAMSRGAEVAALARARGGDSLRAPASLLRPK